MAANSNTRNESASPFANRWYTLILLALVYGLSNLDRYLLGVLLPYIKADMQLSDTLLGLLSGAAFAIFYATLGLPIARLADRYSRKMIIAVSLAVFSIMTALCGLASSFVALFLARVGVGIGEAGTSPASYSIISDHFEVRRRSTAMGVLALGGNVGLLLGFGLGGFIAANWGWRSAFLVCGIPGILLTVVILATMVEPRRGGSSADQIEGQGHGTIVQAVVQLTSIASYRHLIAGMALVQFAGTGLLAWIPSLLDRSYGMSPTQSGPIIAVLVIIAGIVGTLGIGGLLTDRLTRRSMRWVPGIASLGAIVMAIGALGVSLANTHSAALTAYALSAVGSLCFLAPSLSLSQSLAPLRLRATSGALALLVANLLGLGLGAPAIGLTSDILTGRFGPDALSHAILLVPVAGLWGAFHYWQSARYLPPSLLLQTEASNT